MTRNEIESARKDAERFGKFFERIAGIQEALVTALMVHDATAALTQELDTLQQAVGAAERERDELALTVLELQHEQAAQAEALAHDTAVGRAALQATLATEAEETRATLATTYAQLEADCTTLQQLQAEARATLESLAQQIAERRQTLVNVQAQLQAMLVGGGV